MADGCLLPFAWLVEFLGYLDIPSAPEISQEATKNSPTYVHSFP